MLRQRLATAKPSPCPSPVKSALETASPSRPPHATPDGTSDAVQAVSGAEPLLLIPHEAASRHGAPAKEKPREPTLARSLEDIHVAGDTIDELFSM